MVNKEIIKLIDRIILDDNVKDYKHVADDYRSELTIMMLQNDGLDSVDFICCTGEEDRVIAPLIKFMITGETCRALDLAATLEKMAIEWYSVKLEEVFDQRVEELDIEEKKEAGLKSHIDPINGKIVWR